MDRNREKLSILWASPLPPERTGVADYALELLPHLAKLARVRVVEPPGWVCSPGWPEEIQRVATDTVPRDDEIVVVHLGNNPHHRWILDRPALPNPNVVVLHDTVLHHLLVESTVAVGDGDDFAPAVEAAHGEAGAALAAAREVGRHGRLDPFLFPARGPFLNRASAVVVHSDWASKLVRAERPGLPVGRVGLAVDDPGPPDRDAARSHLGLADNDVILMHIGFLTPEKGLDAILTGLSAANRSGVSARLVVVGEGDDLDPLRTAAARVGMDDRLVVTGWTDPSLFGNLPAAADLGVVLRTPSAGETSAAAVRFLACGVPVAVGGARQFLEWPELAAPRLTPGPSAAADLVRILACVGGDAWDERRRAARAAYESNHRPEDAARRMIDFIESLTNGREGSATWSVRP